MILARDIETLQQAILNLAQNGKRIALVPTMGALHSGHASLITQALENADAVVVSIFINPTQFGKNEDFSQYPRTLEADILVAEAAGAEIIYAPTPEDMYPEGFSSTISAGAMGNILCGKFRTGHFDGVATVVTKLLLRVMPHVAVFGAKDYQQLCIIERVVEDLDIPVEIISAPTMRETDGLALSSRNRYLSAEERKTAPFLYQTLVKTVDEMQKTNTESAIAKGVSALTERGFKVDYLEVFEERLLVAAWLGKTRLIDNIAIE